MALVVGENSWETVLEADTYLTDVLGTQSWFQLADTAGAGEASKETYLIMAFNLLVNKAGYCLDASITDQRVKNAQSELAFYFMNNYALFVEQSELASSGIKGFTLSKWKEEFFESWQGDFPLPFQVSNYLTSYNCQNRTVNFSVE